ncbi:MAG: hypothetical protein V1933_00315 [Candidatus Omnitrophota bacterium]
MTLSDITLLVAIYALLFVSYLSIRASAEKKCLLDSNRYKLFKIRDKLIYLVATEKLKEEEFLFKYFYDTTNYLVNQTEKFTLKTLVKAIREYDKEHALLAEKTLIRIKEELLRKNKEVDEAVDCFFSTLLEIFIENSILLRFITKNNVFKQVGRFLYRLYRIVSNTKTVIFEKQAWDEYKNLQDARTMLAAS